MVERHREVVEHREAPQTRALDRRGRAVRQKAQYELVGVGEGVCHRRRHGEDADDPEKSDQSWAPVLAQWVIGAIGGAALWVGFRFLWSSLLVVAIAAAVLVTVGLVIVVRTLLRNTDLRTTLAAVAVGILLTVSPAVLVLLGR